MIVTLLDNQNYKPNLEQFNSSQFVFQVNSSPNVGLDLKTPRSSVPHLAGAPIFF